jgi:N-acetylglucosamine repressor
MKRTNYEKKVLSLIYTHGPLSKREITKQGHMSWGTAVKAVNTLIEKNYIVRSGTMKREGGLGKNAYVFNLSRTKPLVIGIDINHDRTTIILTNLQEDILITQYHQSPASTDDFNIVKSFLSRVISHFIKTYISDTTDLYGIGIGIQTFFFQKLSKNKEHEQLSALVNYLEKKFQVKVRFEVNHRAYAMHEKWDNVVFSHENFLFVSIRNGVGSAIMMNGQLFTGNEGFGGEIGHLKVAPKHVHCRCGSQGCLESVINQNVLFRRYIEEVKGEIFPDNYTQDQVIQELPELFRAATENNQAALKIINDVAEYLGRSLAHALMLFNIPNMLVCGYFGEYGNVLIPRLKDVIREQVYALTEFLVTYRPLKQVGFTRGAALMLLKDFIE